MGVVINANVTIFSGSAPAGESDITAPLRDLLKEQTWKWLEKHEDAWKAIKSVLIKQPVLQFYDVS